MEMIIYEELKQPKLTIDVAESYSILNAGAPETYQQALGHPIHKYNIIDTVKLGKETAPIQGCTDKGTKISKLLCAYIKNQGPDIERNWQVLSSFDRMIVEFDWAHKFTAGF